MSYKSTSRMPIGTQSANRVFGCAGALAMFACIAASPGLAQNSAGSPDTSFGTDGVVTTSPATLGGSVTPITAVEESNGNIAAVVGITNANAEDFGLVLYTSAGALIGTSTASFVAGGISSPTTATIQSDGSIVVVGTASAGTGQPIVAAIARFTPAGKLDTTFGNGGLVTTDIEGTSLAVTSVLVQPNGQIMLGGSAGTGVRGASSTMLARYNADGSLDTTFGTGGIVQATTKLSAPAALALLSNGDYLAVGENPGATKVGLVAEFSPVGTLETGITRSAIAAAPISSQSELIPTIFESFNNDYVIGNTFCTDDSQCRGTKIEVQRFSEKGQLDKSHFNAGSFYSFDERQTTSVLHAMALQSNGQIVTAGLVNDDSPTVGGLARLNAGGTLDTTFGTVDSFGVCCSVTTNQAISGLLVQADGKIVSVGAIGGDLALARYLAQ